MQAALLPDQQSEVLAAGHFDAAIQQATDRRE